MLIQLTTEQNTRIFRVNMAEDLKSPVHASQKLRSCNQCDFASERLGNLKRHMLVHSARKPFKCIQCNYSFTNYANLKRHMMTHSGERCFKCKFNCEQWNYSFTSYYYNKTIIVLRDTCWHIQEKSISVANNATKCVNERDIEMKIFPAISKESIIFIPWVI